MTAWNKIILTKEEEETLRNLLLEKKSLKVISQEMGYSQDTLKRLSKEVMGANFNLKRKSYLNEAYFDEIDTEEKAYWLGFLAADGYIVNNYIQIQLQSQDKGHLQKFSDTIQGNLTLQRIKGTNNFGFDYQHYRISFRSEYMTKSLAKVGIVPKKSLILKYPTFLKPTLQSYWILGYLDGDGSIAKNKQKLRIIFTGTFNVIEGIKNFLNSNNKIVKEHRCENTYRISLENELSFSFLTEINYKELPYCLERKKEKFISLSPSIK